MDDKSEVFEAANLVKRWLAKNVPLSVNDDGNPITYHTHSLTTGDHVTNDYVTRLDWDRGQVGDNVHIILSGLRDTKIKLQQSIDHTQSSPYKGDNPLINMQMRHDEVRKRRKDKDHTHMLALKEEQRQNDIRKRAWHLMKLEEEERKVREKREEEEIQKHVRALRKQVKEQKERERFVKELLEKEEKEKREAQKRHKHAKKHKLQNQLVMEKWEESLIKREEPKDVQQKDVSLTRMILMKQLVEIETKETKHNLMLMRQVFVSWYTLVQEGCGLKKRAKVIGDWRTLSRYWRAWRSVVKENKAQRIVLIETERLRKEKELLSLAECHYRLRLLLKCIIAWRGVVSVAKIHENKSQSRSHLISTFLQTLTSEQEKENKEKRQEITEEKQEMIRKEMKTEMKTPDVIQKRRGPSKGVWSTARAHLDKVLNDSIKQSPNDHEINQETHSHTTPRSHSHTTLQSHSHTTLQSHSHTTLQSHSHTTLQSHSHTTIQSHSHTTDTVIEKPKLTKPLSLKKMEERTALMAERKLARVERRQKREQEMKEEIAAKEEARLKEEKEAKMAEIQRKKEEKLAALEKERQRQLRAEIIAVQTLRAKTHYERKLLLIKGLTPWCSFVTIMREAKKKSDKFHRQKLTLKVLLIWKEKTEAKLFEKDEKAKLFRRCKLLQNSFKAWLIYNDYCRQLTNFAVQVYGYLLIKKTFKGWERLTRQERISYWEKERRSRKHYENYLKETVLKAWRRYVPLSLEEKQQEVRRAELRRKVSLWLPDYEPNNIQN